MSLPDSEPIPPEPTPESEPASVTQPDLEPETAPDQEPAGQPETVPEPAAETAPEATPEEAVTRAQLRRRRSRRRDVPRELDQRAAFFRELVHQATPSFDFFLFSVIAGLFTAAALLLDSPALFILAALLAPFMAPVLGLAVSASIGSLGLFFRSLIALAIGGLLVFALGMLGGWVGLSLPGLAFTQAPFHTLFTWPDMLVLLLGAAFTAYLAVRSPQQRPLVSSVALAYELFVPLAAAGFGLVQPVPGLFPDGLILFASSLVLAAVTATFVLLALGVRPLPSGKAWLASVVLLLVLVGSALFGIYNVVLSGPLVGPVSAVLSSPTPTPKGAMALTATLPPTATETLVPTASETPQPTATTTRTLVPTATPTISFTPSPTPVYGMVNAGDLNGVIIRPEPGSLLIVTTLLNGSLVEILPEVVNKNGFLWIHVRAADGKEGWVQSSLIVTATPRPKN